MSDGGEILIRAARPGDAGGIGELFIATRRTCMPYLPVLHTDDETRRYISDEVMSRCEVWVADIDAGVAGFVAVQGQHIEHLYVRVSDQRRGIGAQLLKKAIELRPGGLTLYVFQQNHQARRFYEAHGFALTTLGDGGGNEEQLPDALYTWTPNSRDTGKLTTTLEGARVLRAGGLVSFPTETVYGLGADATNAEAVRKIFAAKGRPSTNPLIVHVADIETAKRYARTWSDAAQTLAAVWWPGPLTLVVPKTDEIVDEATAGRATVALRVPDHPMALEMLRAFDGPVAAPSANRSTRISPTTAQHVRDDLGDSVNLILDGGPCAVGIESTVLDLTAARPMLLRPGGVSRAAIERIVGPISVFYGEVDTAQSAASPGQHAVHYAPRTPAYRFEISQRDQLQSRRDETANGLLILGHLDHLQKFGPVALMPNEPAVYARHLYEVLRELDAMDLAAIHIEMPPDQPQWLAIRDRLLRATTPLQF